MILSQQSLTSLPKTPDLELPQADYFLLPEKVLQFGTGILLRGLPDYFIDKANKKGIFNGRVVVVKSTGNGGTDAFGEQNGLFTHGVRGIEHGEQVERTFVNASISRVLAASDNWSEILDCAKNRDLKVIVSNTTEVGLTLDKNDNVKNNPPTSFPGKLLAFLQARYDAFGGDPDSGFVIIPTELLPDNGKLLLDICVQLANINGMNPAFIHWMAEANDFCNSLVDRIVPGKLSETDQAELREKYRYSDDLNVMSEPYRLWAIETQKESTKEILSFSKVDEGVVVTHDIDRFRKLKLYLLNSPHTFSCGLALIKGFETVKAALKDEAFSTFVSGLMFDDITPAIVDGDITTEEATAFGKKVLDRFRNPFLEHKWMSIAMQYSSKMRSRTLPVILAYYQRFNKVPERMAEGFGAYIRFMQSELNSDGKYEGSINGKSYVIYDEKAVILYNKWQSGDVAVVVKNVLNDLELWGTDLTLLPGFEAAVTEVVIKYL